MKFEVLNRFTGTIQFVAEIDCAENAARSAKLGMAVRWAVDFGANLRGADLGGADFRDADFRGAGLGGAGLGGADFRDADFRDADFRGANLRGADLGGADFRGAVFRDADLRGAKDVSPLVAAQTSITPEGQFIGWKKCRNNVIVKLTIPTGARRSNATGRKCRAEFVDVTEVFGADVGISTHDGKTQYRAGERVRCDAWCEDRWQECAGGIHFFLTREEAEAY